MITVVSARKHPEYLALALGKAALAGKGVAGALDERIAIGRHVNGNGELLDGLHALNRVGKGKAAQAKNHIGKESEDHNARDKRCPIGMRGKQSVAKVPQVGAEKRSCAANNRPTGKHRQAAGHVART